MGIKIASWNIRGMSETSKQDEDRNLIISNGIGMCGIIETRLNKKVVNSVCVNI